MAKTILIIDDEQAIRDMVMFSLNRADYHCEGACDVYEARHIVATKLPDLILLDWMMPGMSGVEYVHFLRNDPMTQDVPVIMLTARAGEEDKIRGLDMGADDYLTKPFSTKELLARIKAVLRRSSNQSDTLTADGLILDMTEHRLQIDGTLIEIGPTEFRLLHFLMSQSDRVFSRNQILDKVWGADVYIDDRTVDVHIRRLRKLLAPHDYDRYIQTVRGAGYRFSAKI